MDDVHTTFHKLHKFLQSHANAKDLELNNDDLVGFYTSVPQERILQATEHLLGTYVQKQPSQRGPIRFTVDLRQRDARQR